MDDLTQEHEHHFQCKICPERQVWSNAPSTVHAATWHVYTEHPQAWKDVVGDRPPLDPLPETAGHRLS